jgi:tetratricopeptide (TPR) repeat protein/energy-coupling factor transporter ATP-binding protein EcfA2
VSAAEIGDGASHGAAPGETAPTASPLPPDDGTRLSNERPFPGLRPFGFGDRSFFFGRERQAFALYRLVENGRFIAVIGGSGSGKSSLVLAGLQALLADETADSGGPAWAFLDMRPGGAPITRLAGALSKLSAKDSADESARRRDRIEWTLRQSSFSFESALAEAGGLGGRSLILIVDQFEELFRFGLAGVGYRRGGVEEARRRDEATQFVQILLDADRRRIQNVRVLITMRSDFIGDCAFFQGLSEAVSATQYLVPNLTRSRLEEAIRNPIEKAGGTIEPELVERLLNDCGDELDQLPVLQHCLMRLWDRAGTETPAGGARHLTRQTYDAIGRMTNALSRHADEIFAQCAGKELAVEQAFRALSELDREGRAVRRPLRFEKLLAETGVGESDLRAVLDSFRAPSCSFLVPPASLAATLLPEDRIDIGHETLLRRWKRLSGEIETVEVKTGRPAAGWLGEEQGDGQRYRTLVSLLDDETGGRMATLNDPDRMKRWWDSRPRTPAWAERYGGGNFAGVKTLIDDAVTARLRLTEAEQRSKHIRRLSGISVGAFFLASILAGVAWFATQQSARQRQEEIDTSAMRSAKTLLEDVLEAYNSKSLDLAGAESLATISGQFLQNVRASTKTSAADLLWGQSLIVETDLQATLNNNVTALALAKQAKDIGLSLTQSNANSPQTLQLLYDATIRVGNALAALGGTHSQDALEEYNAAIGIAEKLVASSDSDAGADDLINAHLRIGDTHTALRQYDEALTEYRSALSLAEGGLAKHPESFNLLRNQGKTFFRIAELFRTRGSFDDARVFYQKAVAVQRALVSRNAQEAVASQRASDPTLKSNLAATYTHWGLLEKTAGDLNVALAKFQQGIALDEELVKSEPGNPQWLGFLTPNYLYIAQILEQLNRPEDALVYYQELFDARRRLVLREPGRPRPQTEFAEAAKLLGDRATGLARIDAYRAAVRTWNQLIDDPKLANLAADQFAAVLGFAHAFDAMTDWPDAQTAYRVAMKIAAYNFVKNPEDTSWRDKAEAAQRASVAAGEATETAPADPPH